MVDLPPPPAIKADARDFRVWGAPSTGPKDASVTKFEALDTDLDVLIEEDRREVGGGGWLWKVLSVWGWVGDALFPAVAQLAHCAHHHLACF